MKPMSRVLVAGAIAAAGVAALVAAGVGARPTTAATAKTARSAQVARGRYLVSIMGCGDCHTPASLYGKPDMSRMLSGSELGWKGPWGVSYPRNITPDKETGIGTWTEAQIVRAITRGQRPDGSALLPPMPWPELANLAPADARAIAAYLKTIPAVKHEAPKVIPPDQPATGAYLDFPPPPEWDTPK